MTRNKNWIVRLKHFTHFLCTSFWLFLVSAPSCLCFHMIWEPALTLCKLSLNNEPAWKEVFFQTMIILVNCSVAPCEIHFTTRRQGPNDKEQELNCAVESLCVFSLQFLLIVPGVRSLLLVHSCDLRAWLDSLWTFVKWQAGLKRSVWPNNNNFSELFYCALQDKIDCFWWY